MLYQRRNSDVSPTLKLDVQLTLCFGLIISSYILFFMMWEKIDTAAI